MLLKKKNSLPSKQRVVLSLYYYEELNLREIGSLLEVTESRVSQLHTRGLEELKEAIHRYEKIQGNMRILSTEYEEEENKVYKQVKFLCLCTSVLS